MSKAGVTWSSLPWPELEALMKALSAGNPPRMPTSRDEHFDSILRHLIRWHRGEALDPETGVDHRAVLASLVLHLFEGDGSVGSTAAPTAGPGALVAAPDEGRDAGALERTVRRLRLTERVMEAPIEALREVTEIGWVHYLRSHQWAMYKMTGGSVQWSPPAGSAHQVILTYPGEEAGTTLAALARAEGRLECWVLLDLLEQSQPQEASP